MTNKLKPILIPTEDASIIYLQYDLLRIGKHIVKSKGEESNQHLYLVSDQPIKEGDWCLNITWEKEDGGKRIGKADVFYKELEGSIRWKKIILTTDPKLIADGVPAIDGNTMATKYVDTLNFGNAPIVINFFEEFCKLWNDKADIVIEYNNNTLTFNK